MKSALIKKVDPNQMALDGALTAKKEGIEVQIKVTEKQAKENHLYAGGKDWFYVQEDAHKVHTEKIWKMTREYQVEQTAEGFLSQLEMIVHSEDFSPLQIVIEDDDGNDHAMNVTEENWFMVEDEEYDIFKTISSAKTLEKEPYRRLTIHPSGQIYVEWREGEIKDIVEEVVKRLQLMDNSIPLVEKKWGMLEKEPHPLSGLEKVVEFLSEQKSANLLPEGINTTLTTEFLIELNQVAKSYSGKVHYR